MTGEEMYEIWAPPGSLWSPWVKPVIFAQYEAPSEPPVDDVPQTDDGVPWATSPSENCLVVVDLPGARSLTVGLALAAQGFRPVPLYDACNSPRAIVRLDGILSALPEATAALGGIELADDAPPVFLLDSQRQTDHVPLGLISWFDNRWLTFPQDFPSIRFLLSHGLKTALLVQQKRTTPMDDLAHVLLRWQEGGLTLRSVDLAIGSQPSPLLVQPPARFHSMFYRALAVLGLRRNSAGGFGSVVLPASAG
jgi:hypothetical protein